MVNTASSTRSPHDSPSDAAQRTQSPLSRAWVAVALIPVFFFISFAVQEVIYSMTGYDPSSSSVPLSANLAAGIPGLAILLVPCVAGVVYGERARRSGVRAGLLPEVISALLGIGAIVLTAVNL